MRVPPPGDRRRWALGGGAILAVAVALAIVALTGQELSRAELVAEGDEICAAGRQAFEELQEEPPRTATEAADLTRRLIEIAEQELDALDRLNHPSDLDAAIDSYRGAREEAIELLREGLEAAEAADSRRYQVAQEELAATQSSRRRMARRIGFRECSRPLGPP
jgi:hypothetical protein